ncbi:DUF2190 family protein [Accumulibacter sp.]|uniref:DUF2190 family protein n=1 Tax=Accumulibacter sp. TaxID=2053492 RepID=UPI002879DAA6|nr:DUF2190 family protein [Accumulibacter sp.]MDS4056441.1 DUF2190 family protein [Accumulibacter sp.]HMW55134.1 DUF2190 family protein [Accumulibacter sp.]HMW79193.1 DUF2190 family protein [Accumulibacter sp.]
MGTQSKSVLTLTVGASGTISAARFVTTGGAQAGADANTLGVAVTSAVAGDKIPVDVLGTTTVEAGAAVSAGATVKADASGRAIAWATSGAKVGVALEAATAAGQFIEVLLIPNAV